MAVDALLATLEREAEAQRLALERAADLRAERIQAEAEAELERHRSLALERERERCRRASDRELAERRRGLLRTVLEARTTALDRVFARADALLARLPGSAYANQLPAMVASTLGYLEGTPAVLTCAPDVEDAVRQAAAGRGVGVTTSPDAPAGLVGRAENGSVTVDASLTARLAALRPDLTIDICRGETCPALSLPEEAPHAMG